MKREFLSSVLFLSVLVCTPIFTTLKAEDSVESAEKIIPHETKESDLEIAQRFAPVVINQISADPKKAKYDVIDEVLYTVAQTDTHIFIKYEIMKGWSDNPHIPASKFITDFSHPVDSEDIALVIYKVKSTSPINYVWLTMEKQLHDKRTVTVNPEARKYFDKNEIEALDVPNEAVEKSFVSHFLFSSEAKKYMEEFFLNGVSTVDGHVVVLSSEETHALCTTYVPRAVLKSGERTKSYYREDCAYQNGTFQAGLPEGMEENPFTDGVKVQTYQLRPLAQVLKERRYSDSTLWEKNVQHLYGKSRIINIKGEQYHTGPYPICYDVRSYLEKYHPEKLEEIAKLRSSKREFYLDTPEANTALSRQASGGTVTEDCAQLNPALAFMNTFEKSAEAQQLSPVYSRYELVTQDETTRKIGSADKLIASANSFVRDSAVEIFAAELALTALSMKARFDVLAPYQLEDAEYFKKQGIRKEPYGQASVLIPVAGAGALNLLTYRALSELLRKYRPTGRSNHSLTASGTISLGTSSVVGSLLVYKELNLEVAEDHNRLRRLHWQATNMELNSMISDMTKIFDLSRREQSYLKGEIIRRLEDPKLREETLDVFEILKIHGLGDPTKLVLASSVLDTKVNEEGELEYPMFYPLTEATLFRVCDLLDEQIKAVDATHQHVLQQSTQRAELKAATERLETVRERLRSLRWDVFLCEKKAEAAP